MKIRSGRLNGKGYYYLFLAGAKRILENQKELNRINVFPVPDADTGSNLASTVRTVIERVRPDRSYKVTSRAIAAAALEGARGNSGVIFAQFLYGLDAESRDAPEVSLTQFAQSARNAVRHMYEAIADPVEGTMITVIRKWAESVALPHRGVGELPEGPDPGPVPGRRSAPGDPHPARGHAPGQRRRRRVHGRGPLPRRHDRLPGQAVPQEARLRPGDGGRDRGHRGDRRRRGPLPAIAPRP